MIPPLNNLLSIKDLSKEQLIFLLNKANDMKQLVLNPIEQFNSNTSIYPKKVIALAFYESSSRTRCSFLAAALRLGYQVLELNPSISSENKGESYEDSMRTLDSYSDAIIIRHPIKGNVRLASTYCNKPIINAGDGTGEHPTQALLDLFTIQSELGKIGGESENEKMTIAILGDLKNGRTVHSLVEILCHFSFIRLILIAPAGLELPQEYENLARSNNIEVIISSNLEEIVPQVDVLYVTRIQRERFSDLEEYNKVLGSYCVNSKLMSNAKSKMIVMHPLPRLEEISQDFDKDPKAAYFRQMENGMYMRMAILENIIMKK